MEMTELAFQCLIPAAEIAEESYGSQAIVSASSLLFIAQINRALQHNDEKLVKELMDGIQHALKRGGLVIDYMLVK
jgi:mevalonate kinase